MTVTATKDYPGEVTGDALLTRAKIRDAAEATRTGMSMENLYFIVNVEALGGTKAEGVQLNISFTL
jgi:hypothetical protein